MTVLNNELFDSSASESASAQTSQKSAISAQRRRSYLFALVGAFCGLAILALVMFFFWPSAGTDAGPGESKKGPKASQTKQIADAADPADVGLP